KTVATVTAGSRREPKRTPSPATGLQQLAFRRNPAIRHPRRPPPPGYPAGSVFSGVSDLNTRLALALAVSLGVALPAYSLTADAAAGQTAQQANPFFAESPLPLHYPQFDRI